MTSIIIGCYNVAPWLREKRLMDIRQQSDANIEIILVDDGSTDDTPVLLQTLAEEDSRIRIITKENGGLGSARNAGLEAARGEYVWFYDVDDEAEPHLVEKNVEWMTTHHTELNIFSFKATTPAQHLTEDVIFEEQLVESNEALHDIFLDKLFFVRYGNGFAWNKFYNRCFLENHGIRFGNQRIQQDELFNLQIYPLAQRVYISSEPLYHYFIYEHGNARSRYIPHRYAIYRSIFEGIRHFSEKWSLQDSRLEDYMHRRLYDGISQTILFNTFHPDSPLDKKGKKGEIMQILHDPSAKKCIHYIAQQQPRSLEQRLYLKAYQNESFNAICWLRQIFGLLRNIKKQMNRVIHE